MKLKFGHFECDNFKELSNKLIEYLKTEFLSDEDYLGNKFHDLLEIFRFVYFEKGEDFTKIKISNDFNIHFIEKNELDLYSLEVPREYHRYYQKYNFLIYRQNTNIILIIDSIYNDFLKWLIENVNADSIEIMLCRKNDILMKIQEIFEIELLKFCVQPNPQNTYSPSVLTMNLQTNSKKTITICIFFILLFILFSFKSVVFSVSSIVIFNIFYLTSIFYKLFLSTINQELKFEIIENSSDKIPVYTILLPILREKKKIIMQLLAMIKKINYPQHQLDIKILLEEGDDSTINTMSEITLGYNYDIIIIPNSVKYEHPKTKARACNYVFNFAKGEYLVIYDADDIANPNQLQFALQKFNENTSITCIQFPLNSYNSQENFLTKCYSIEFDLWYKVFLPALSISGMPVTFGGTSNHFRIKSLEENLWDAYNLTEDADLGIRWWLKEIGVVYITREFDTKEEAPIFAISLIKQRSRWIKGFIQTYFSHIKYIFSEGDYKKKASFLSFMNLFILLPIVAQLSFIPNIFEFLVLKFFHIQENITVIGYTTIILFIVSFCFQVITILIKREKIFIKSFPSYILFPIYSIILNVIAGYKATLQLLFKPFYWEKTNHGISKENYKEKSEE